MEIQVAYRDRSPRVMCSSRSRATCCCCAILPVLRPWARDSALHEPGLVTDAAIACCCYRRGGLGVGGSSVGSPTASCRGVSRGVEDRTMAGAAPSQTSKRRTELRQMPRLHKWPAVREITVAWQPGEESRCALPLTRRGSLRRVECWRFAVSKSSAGSWRRRQLREPQPKAPT